MIELRLTDAQGRILQGGLEDAATQRPAMTKVYQRLLTEIGRQIRYENFTVPGNDEYTQEEYEKNQEFFEDDGEQKLFLLKDELEEPEEEVMFRDFPHIEFPQSLRDRGFEDQSYRNDASARASYFPEGVTGYPSLDVFVAEEIPGEREYPDAERFGVCLLLSEGTEDQCTLFASESETEMLAYVDGILERLKGKVDAQIIEEVKKIYRENARQEQVEKIAKEFSRLLRDDNLTPSEMKEVIERNAAETNESVCHSHDFCDANMVMDEAFRNLDMPVPVGLEQDTPEQIAMFELWNDAWDLAKAKKFYTERS